MQADVEIELQKRMVDGGIALLFRETRGSSPLGRFEGRWLITEATVRCTPSPPLTASIPAQSGQVHCIRDQRRTCCAGPD